MCSLVRADLCCQLFLKVTIGDCLMKYTRICSGDRQIPSQKTSRIGKTLSTMCGLIHLLNVLRATSTMVGTFLDPTFNN